MKLAELLQGIPAVCRTADPEMEISGVAYDSRKVTRGALFAAIPGFTVDGNQFIPKALEAGAAAVLSEQPPWEGIPWIQVQSARAALAALGANWYGHPAEKMKLVGVTGTNGKTTVTMLLKTVLERVWGAKVGLIGTIQNMVGSEILQTERTTPESFELQGLLRRMADAGCSVVVMEVSSHALALDRVGGIRFSVGVFTNLTEDHLDFHKTMEAYLQAKARLFRRCEWGVMNLDDPASEKIMKEASCHLLTTGVSREDADLRAEQMKLDADRVSFLAVRGEERVPVSLGIPGTFSVYNALSVLGAALALGMELPAAAAALGEAHGVKGRVEVVPVPADYTVLIDYAHTPDGLENVLRTARGFCRGRLVVLFGCGGNRDPMKRPIMGKIAGQLADVLVITSDNPRREEPSAIIRDILKGVNCNPEKVTVIENRRMAIAWALGHCRSGDVLVLAGKGHETYQELADGKHHLDEREEVAAWFAGRGARKEGMLNE